MNSSGINYSRGVGLIEVLITMLLLSTVLLTLASLQTRALQYNQSSYFRSQANILAYDVLDKIRVNKANIAIYNQSLALSSNIATSPVDIYEWAQEVNSKLPSSKVGVVCVSSTRLCTVTISWGELNSSEHNFGGTQDDTTTFSYMTRISE